MSQKCAEKRKRKKAEDNRREQNKGMTKVIMKHVRYVKVISE